MIGLTSPHRRLRARLLAQSLIEPLETRLLLSADVLTYHFDAGSTGNNPFETILTPSNVSTSTFGKLFSVTVDGQVYAQPLYKANVNITTGANQGRHNVVFVATQNDSLYAFDAQTGTQLWKDSFLAAPFVTGFLTCVAVPNGDVMSSTINPKIGITSTPVIDAASNTLYVTAKTKETRSGDPTGAHYVYRLYGINISNGAMLRSTVIADTFSNAYPDPLNGTTDTFISGPSVNGNGDASVGGVLTFDARIELQRPAVTLFNGNILLGFGSHGDRGPYHGWLLAYNAATFATTGVFCTTPNHDTNVDAGTPTNYNDAGAIWMSGGGVATDPQGFMYVTTGNGAFPTNYTTGAASYFDANGFPLSHSYGNAVLKIAFDPNSSQNNQNGNGWGLKVIDYFVPSNQVGVNIADADLGSGAPMIVPDAFGIVGHPHLLLVGSKEGRIYLIDRDNMGKFNTSYPANSSTADPLAYDNVVAEYATNSTLNNGNFRFYSTFAFFNGTFYANVANNSSSGTQKGRAWTITSFASNTLPASAPNANQSTTLINGRQGSVSFVSSNGTSNAIVWNISIGIGAQASNSRPDDLMAYNAGNYTNTIYDSNGNVTRDALASGNTTQTLGIKFSVPIVSNGLVYLGALNTANGTGGSFVAYGLLNPSLHVPGSLVANATGPTNIHLTWTRQGSDQESELVLERSTDNTNWSAVAILANGTTSYDDDTVSAGTQYFYRAKQVYGGINTTYSGTANTTTPNPLNLLNVVSRKTQGAGLLDLTMPLTGLPGVEYRTTGPTTLRFTFDNAPTLGAGYSVTLSSGTAGSTTISGNTLSLNLSGVANQSVLTVSLHDVSGNDFGITLGVLLGDFTQSGKVELDDLTVVANHWQTSGTAGDTNGDDFVDIGDLTSVANNWQFAISGGGFGAATGFASEPLGPAFTTTAALSTTPTASHSTVPPSTSAGIDSSEEDPRALKRSRNLRKTLILLTKIPRP